MGSLATMLSIANALIDLSSETLLEKISISDIIENVGKNRKTFYYHFENKESLIRWIFRYDLSRMLKKRFPETILVYEPEEGPYAEFPYYITKKSGVRSLDHSAFFSAFAKTLEERQGFYSQALACNDTCSLRNYLYNLYLPALRNDIGIILSNRYLSEESTQFLADFYTSAFLYYFIHKCEQGNIRHFLSDAGPFSNIIHSSLEMEIQEMQLKRNM